MNDIQSFIDRQLGFYCRYNYDNALRRLVVESSESFHGLQNANPSLILEPDPPIFACRFAEAAGYEHILALADENGWVALQNTNTTASSIQATDKFLCHNNAVFDLAWMPGQMNFVTVSGDHTASLWDICNGQPRRLLVFSNHTRSVKTAVFRPTEPSAFATGARDGHILVWDIRANGQPAVVLKPDNCLMNCHSCFTPKTPGSHSKRSRVDTHRAISITGLVFQDDFTLISCGECDGNIKVWDLRKNYSTYKREPLPKHVIPYCGSSTKNGYTNLIVDDSRMRLYASCMDNVIYCFNISTYNALPEQRYAGHENSTFYIKASLSPDSRYLVSGSSDKNAYVWNVKCPEPLVRLTGHWAEVTCAAWCQTGDTKIVTCSDDARHKIWRIGRESLDRDEQAALMGRAEPVPRTAAPATPHWGAPDTTPGSSKRRLSAAGSAPRSAKRHCVGRDTRTKRCLIDTMNTYRDRDAPEEAAKRPRLELPSIDEHDERPPLLPAGVKRVASHISRGSSPGKQQCRELVTGTGSAWIPTCSQFSSTYTTPTKGYNSENAPPPDTSPRSPAVRLITFTTPTKNLPNFVLDGEAPHLRLMSPVKKKQETTNWLTRMTRERKGKPSASESIDRGLPAATPLSPQENGVGRQQYSHSHLVHEKQPKSNVKGKPLLRYFSISTKEK